MSPATAAPAMSAFVVFIWFLVSFFELPHSATVSHGEVLKTGWFALRDAFYEDYASISRMELEYFCQFFRFLRPSRSGEGFDLPRMMVLPMRIRREYFSFLTKNVGCLSWMT